jgi:ABC-2 type transport system ATP-binding protein
MNNRAIETGGLVRRFGRKAAIDGVDLAIEPNTIAALVGPNGAGKTTLLQLLLGLLEPTEGTAEVLGHSSRMMPAQVAPQIQSVGDRHEPPPYVRLNELANLQQAACAKFDRQFFTRLLFDHSLNPSARFGTLSKGQRRWALAALALASFPRVLLMDEPADGLDPAARRMLYEQLRQYVNETEATVLVSSHVLSDLERVADEVVVLRSGRIVLCDSLELLREQTRELTLHVGEATPAFLDQFQLIAEHDDGLARRKWIRLRQGEGRDESHAERALEHADSHAGVHHVNLESLYFALTESERPRDEPAISAAEVVPCS